jgi:hypothetical protein
MTNPQRGGTAPRSAGDRASSGVMRSVYSVHTYGPISGDAASSLGHTVAREDPE